MECIFCKKKHTKKRPVRWGIIAVKPTKENIILHTRINGEMIAGICPDCMIRHKISESNTIPCVLDDFKGCEKKKKTRFELIGEILSGDVKNE